MKNRETGEALLRTQTSSCITDFYQSPSYRQYKIAVLQIDLGEVNAIEKNTDWKSVPIEVYNDDVDYS